MPVKQNSIKISDNFVFILCAREISDADVFKFRDQYFK